MTTDPHPAPLAGVRVLDVATMIAAPTTATILADYGADVVKVELPDVGDSVRQFGGQKSGQGLYWKALGRGKRSVALDLRTTEAKQLLIDWVPQFDVFIENFRPGTLERWGIGPEVLHAAHPQLVILRATAYGQDGPYREQPGFGTLAEALVGIPSVSGFEDRAPLLPAFPMADIMAGSLGASAVLAAVRGRQYTGRGDIIDLAIYEAALKLMEINILEYQQLGIEHKREGNRYGPAAPRGSYACRDGRWIALSGSTQATARNVLFAIGGRELVDDERFQTNADRRENIEDLDRLIAEWCRLRDRDDALALLNSNGCAVGPLETVPSMMSNPQIVHRGSIVTVDDSELGPLAMTGSYPRFSSARTGVGEPGRSEIGADTEDVLTRDLELDKNALENLWSAGAIGLPRRVPAEREPR